MMHSLWTVIEDMIDGHTHRTHFVPGGLIIDDARWKMGIQGPFPSPHKFL